jgi:hypothetical protein
MSEMMTVDEMGSREVRIRKILQERYPSSPLLIPVRAVGEILGVPHRTIYGQVKRNTLFIPYRIINRTAMIDVEDLVRWYVDNPQPRQAIVTEPLPEDPFKKAILDLLNDRDSNPVEWLRKMKRRQ